MPQKQLFKRLRIKRVWLLVILFGLTLFWRSWYASRHVAFAQDQARDLLAVEKLAQDGVWVVGYSAKASVSDFRWPPLYYELLMITGRLTHFYPFALQDLIIILESVTPILIALTLEFWLGLGPAIGLASLYAISPLTTIFGTFNWNPNLIPFFTATTIYGLLAYYYKKSKWGLVWGMALPMIALQLHFQAALIGLFVLGFGVYVLIEKRSDWRWLILGIIIGGISYLPYVWAEATHNFINTRTILEFFDGSNGHIYDRVSKPMYILSFLPGFFERVLTGIDWPKIWLGRVVWFVGGGCLLWAAYKDKKARLLVLLIASSLLMVRLYKGDKLDYYLSAIFFAPYFLLAGIYKKLPYLAVMIGLFIGVMAMRTNLTEPTSNSWRDLQDAMHFIAQTTHGQGISMYYKMNDVKNIFRYGLDHAGIVPVANGRYRVYICAASDPCHSYVDDAKGVVLGEIQEYITGSFKVVTVLVAD